jgi:aerobic carbon-monoxide dehydrogenase small subunit
MTVSFILNGEDVGAKARSVDRLSDILRDSFGLLGVSSDCRCGRCGRCLVFLDNRLVPSCIVPAFAARGREIVTIEGYALTEDYIDISAGFIDAGVVTCGFCEAPKIMAAGALLERSPRPTPREILEHMSSAPCRCTDPDAIVKAVQAAAELKARRLYRRAGQ